MTPDAMPADRQLALAPLDEKVDHVRGSPVGHLIIEYGEHPGHQLASLNLRHGLGISGIRALGRGRQDALETTAWKESR